MEHKNTQENLTELQSAAVEAYRQRLAENLPDVEILDVFATDGIIEVKLNDASMRDYSTMHRVTGLAIKVADQFDVTLLPCTVPYGIETHERKNANEDLTELQAAVVETYRQQLAENLPEVEILDAFATDGIIEVRLNDVVMRDYSTLHCATGLSIEVEDKFNVTLLPHTVPHEN